MTYTIFYRSENGKNYFGKVVASTKKEAEAKLKAKYHDITEIVQINEEGK